MTDRSFAKAMAERALRDANITSPPVELDDLARTLALRIERNVDMAPGLRAAYRPELGLIQVIVLPPQVERFPVAHELGHALLGDGGRLCTEAMIKEQSDAVPLDEAMASFNPESAASAIASELLVPSAWLRPAVGGRTVEELRELFDVTKPVLLLAIMRDRLLNKIASS